METYHKIITLFERDPATNLKKVIDGKFALPEFEYLKNNIWAATEKVDGTNIRIIYFPLTRKVLFRGKTDEASIPTFLLEVLQIKFTPERMESVFDNSDVCLYGEGYGNKIQKDGKEYLPDRTDFILFDAKIGKYFLERNNLEEVAVKLSIGIVPIVVRASLLCIADIVKTNFESRVANNPFFRAEGLVAKPECEMYNRKGERIITKLKCKDYLI